MFYINSIREYVVNAGGAQRLPPGGVMTELSGDDAVILALIERFVKQRLPRLKQLSKKVDEGEVLSDVDIEFLEIVIHDAQQSKRLIDMHPRWQAFCADVVHLFKTITEKAQQNEKKMSNR